ncbi:MAG: aspartyl protease family protein [Pseudomonadota bacterium]
MSQRIECRHEGLRVTVPVLILNPSPSTSFDGVQGRALLDTGSTTTGITTRLAHQLGLVARGKKPIGSAQGEGQAERYLFRVGLHGEGKTPTLPYVFDDVIGFELVNSFRFEALIGMDVISQCNLEMTRNGICTLEFG